MSAETVTMTPESELPRIQQRKGALRVAVSASPRDPGQAESRTSRTKLERRVSFSSEVYKSLVVPSFSPGRRDVARSAHHGVVSRSQPPFQCEARARGFAAGTGQKYKGSIKYYALRKEPGEFRLLSQCPENFPFVTTRSASAGRASQTESGTDASTFIRQKSQTKKKFFPAIDAVVMRQESATEKPPTKLTLGSLLRSPVRNMVALADEGDSQQECASSTEDPCGLELCRSAIMRSTRRSDEQKLANANIASSRERSNQHKLTDSDIANSGRITYDRKLADAKIVTGRIRLIASSSKVRSRDQKILDKDTGSNKENISDQQLLDKDTGTIKEGSGDRNLLDKDTRSSEENSFDRKLSYDETETSEERLSDRNVADTKGRARKQDKTNADALHELISSLICSPDPQTRNILSRFATNSGGANEIDLPFILPNLLPHLQDLVQHKKLNVSEQKASTRPPIVRRSATLTSTAKVQAPANKPAPSRPTLVRRAATLTSATQVEAPAGQPAPVRPPLIRRAATLTSAPHAETPATNQAPSRSPLVKSSATPHSASQMNTPTDKPAPTRPPLVRRSATLTSTSHVPAPASKQEEGKDRQEETYESKKTKQLIKEWKNKTAKTVSYAGNGSAKQPYMNLIMACIGEQIRTPCS